MCAPAYIITSKTPSVKGSWCFSVLYVYFQVIITQSCIWKLPAGWHLSSFSSAHIRMSMLALFQRQGGKLETSLPGCTLLVMWSIYSVCLSNQLKTIELDDGMSSSIDLFYSRIASCNTELNQHWRDSSWITTSLPFFFLRRTTWTCFKSRCYWSKLLQHWISDPNEDTVDPSCFRAESELSP